MALILRFKENHGFEARRNLFAPKQIGSVATLTETAPEPAPAIQGGSDIAGSPDNQMAERRSAPDQQRQPQTEKGGPGGPPLNVRTILRGLLGSHRFGAIVGFLSDTSRLTATLTKVVQLGATNAATAHDGDGVDLG